MANEGDVAEQLREELEHVASDQRLEFLRNRLLSSVEPAKRAEAEILIFLILEAPRIVVLVHGIRTNAEWQDDAEAILTRSGRLKVFPIKYGVLNTLRFWFPFGTRHTSINYVLRELRDIRSQHPSAEISVAAHSFGSYAILKILQNETDVRLHRLLLCGAVVEKGLRWDQIPRYPSGGVLNLCGTRDIWPVVASKTSWGYGFTGRFGFGTNRVTDRFFDCNHSGCLEKAFIETHWVPFLERGFVAAPQGGRLPTPIWMIVLLLTPNWVISGLVLILLLHYL